MSPAPIARLEERISVLDLRAEEARAIEEVTASPTISPPRATFLTCFERCAQSRPDALAVRFGTRQLSYAELDARASLLAGFLRALFRARTAPSSATGGVERAVAVCLKPSLEVAIAIVAIFKAEGVYVPLDPSYPGALLAGILDEVAPVCVLTDSERAGAELPDSVQLFRLDTDWALAEARAKDGAGSARDESTLGDPPKAGRSGSSRKFRYDNNACITVVGFVRLTDATMLNRTESRMRPSRITM